MVAAYTCCTEKLKNVYDSAEKHQIVLEEWLINFCVGDGLKLVKMIDDMKSGEAEKNVVKRMKFS